MLMQHASEANALMYRDILTAGGWIYINWRRDAAPVILFDAVALAVCFKKACRPVSRPRQLPSVIS